MLKTIAIYWNHDSDDLGVLPDVRVLTCGADGMEVVGSDADIDALYQTVLGNPDKLTLAQEPREADEADLRAVLDFHRPGGAWPSFETVEQVRDYFSRA